MTFLMRSAKSYQNIQMSCFDSECCLERLKSAVIASRVLDYKTCLDTKPVLYQDRFCIFYRSYKTGFVSKRVNSHSRFRDITKPVLVRQVTKPVLYQDRFCIFYRNYKTGFVPKRVNSHSRFRDSAELNLPHQSRLLSAPKPSLCRP